MTPTATVATAVIATVATTGVATGLATGAEIAELAGQFGIERIVERDGDALDAGTTGGSCRRGNRRTLAAGATIATVRAAIATVTIATVTNTAVTITAIAITAGGRRCAFGNHGIPRVGGGQADLALLVDLLDDDVDLLTER